jgi:hypothetical protein
LFCEAAIEGGVWVPTAAKDRSIWGHYERGAMYVSGTLLPAGCAGWVRI